jgi:hypothetical protein
MYRSLRPVAVLASSFIVLALIGCDLGPIDPALVLSIEVGSTEYAHDGTLDFGMVSPLDEPLVVTAELRNITEKDITVTAVSVDNLVFVAGTPALPFTVAGGESVELSLSFDPTASGAAVAGLSATIDGADLPFVLNLTGEGNFPPVAEVIVNVTDADPSAMNGTYELTAETSLDGNRVYALPGSEYKLYGEEYGGSIYWFFGTDLVTANSLCEHATTNGGLSAPSTGPGWWEGSIAATPNTIGEIESPPYGMFVDVTVSANYRFADPESDVEGTTLFQWFRSEPSDMMGSYTEISGAVFQSYTLVAADKDCHVQVRVTPVAESGITGGEPIILGPGPKIRLPPT